ncbi:hypothetical protein IJ384_04440 [bacterium]|nr:hypothetical protein [bacterium]
MQVKTIKPIHKKPIFSPKELLSVFEQGKRPGYRHSNDILQKELEILAEQYKASFSLDKKRELLSKERDILYQELEYPEYTLARNYNAIKKLFGRSVKKDEIRDVLRLFNITGIKRIEMLSGVYRHKSPESRIDILEKAYKSFSEETVPGIRGKGFVIEVLSTLRERNPELKEKINTTYKSLLEDTKKDWLKQNISQAIPVFDKKQILNKIKEKSGQTELLSLLLNSEHNDSEIANAVNNLLKANNTDINIQRLAVWGAGMHKTDDNFEIIKKIALNKDEPDIRKREFAIHSVALYLKRKPEEVKDIISKVKNEKSEFSVLGKVLDDKVNGNYHGQKNRELHYLEFNEEQIENFRKNIDNFYKTEKSLNTQQENACHRATVYLNNILEKIVNKGNKYYLQDDTFTKQDPQNTGKRYINDWGGIYNSGDFYDAFDGICTTNFNMMNFYRVTNSAHTNVLAHENAHTLNCYFDEKDLLKLNKLYENAKENDIFLDNYAKGNPREYFAQGCMSYATTYLPHNTLLNSYDHTRYELKDIDPELYKFIEYVLKKYN